MDSNQIECWCVGCGPTHQLVQHATTREPLDDGEFAVTNCSDGAAALITKAGSAAEEPPELCGSGSAEKSEIRTSKFETNKANHNDQKTKQKQ